MTFESLAKSIKRQHTCSECGFDWIYLGEEYGWISCVCDNPKLKKLIDESVRVD